MLTLRALLISLRGQVQGVGFRPHVWRQADRFGVRGHVLNDGNGVVIHAQDGDLEGFLRALVQDSPALSVIDQVERVEVPYQANLTTFSILESQSRSVGESGTAEPVRLQVTPDVVVCDDCLKEIATPAERRYRYPFANCTQCGPRFSIIESVPYDRKTTTMRAFALCEDCEAEFQDPADRRFHAQPIACPVCGPRIWFEEKSSRPDVPLEDAQQAPLWDEAGLAAAVQALKRGGIVAIKGLGGFHLACDALNEDAVSLLRTRKRRPHKPFALMARDSAMVARYAAVNEVEAAALTSSAGPIVLLTAKGASVAPSVATDQGSLGWMLPPTPLHVLLLQDFGGPLVMTSGNLSGEPQVIGNEEAREKLAPFVDGYLMHDRDIARRLDDSVVRVVAGVPRMQRRARGYAPSVLPLPKGFESAPPVAAYGAFLKAALCVTRDGSALLSHHLGDLDDDLTAREFAKADADYAALFDHQPAVIACDAHPDYPSTVTAQARAESLSLPLIPVQHHHAHIAAAMAENGWRDDDGPVVGVAMDGLGYGDDGTVWGGEWLLARYDGFERLAHLKPVPLPGGNAAQREPWRNLMAHLDVAGLEGEADALLADRPLSILRAAVSKGVNAPLSSSCGRLFDAFAALIGISPDHQTFEGQAAMALETLAIQGGQEVGYPFDVLDAGVVDSTGMWHAALGDLKAGVAPEIMAARFQAGLARAIVRTARALKDQTGASAIALSGGCFQNATLLAACLEHLQDVPVLTHEKTPPNDGGIALGQAVVAARKAESS